MSAHACVCMEEWRVNVSKWLSMCRLIISHRRQKWTSVERVTLGEEQSGKRKAGFRDNDKQREKKYRARDEPALWFLALAHFCSEGHYYPLTDLCW